MSLAWIHQVTVLLKDEPRSGVLCSLFFLSYKNLLMLKMSLIIWIHSAFPNGEITWRDETTFFFYISPKHTLWFQSLVGTQQIVGTQESVIRLIKWQHSILCFLEVT